MIVSFCYKNENKFIDSIWGRESVTAKFEFSLLLTFFSDPRLFQIMCVCEQYFKNIGNLYYHSSVMISLEGPLFLGNNSSISRRINHHILFWLEIHYYSFVWLAIWSFWVKDNCSERNQTAAFYEKWLISKTSKKRSM